MTTRDDLHPLKEFPEALETLDNLMAQQGRVFLIGAGCSKCAGLPLMEELTNKVLEYSDLGSDASDILKGIENNFEGATTPNIEDYLSEIVDLLAIAERRAERNAKIQVITIHGTEYSKGQLSNAAALIKRAIASIIEFSGTKINTSVHRNFVKAIHRPTRPGKSNDVDRVDYICLNYDTLLEDALALERISYSDGLDGGVTGWWNPELFERKDLRSRIFKLHGSINWCEFDNDPLPRRVSGNINITEEDNRRILIWPASTKYRETQHDPYALLSDLARNSLKANHGAQKILITCGYRFADTHINIEIERALRESDGRLTVVAFTSDDSPQGQLKKWHEDNIIREQVLIFSNKGFFHGDTRLLSEKDLLWWKFENLTRLLSGER